MEPSRRRFMTSSAGAAFALLAGCSGTEEMEGGDHNDGSSGGGASTTVETTVEPTNTPTMTPTSTPTATSTPTPEKEANVTIENSKLQKKKSSYRTEAYILGTIVNKGNGVSGEVTVKGRFYDENDNLLDSSIGTLHYLKPGETWVCYIPYLDDGAKVKSHKIDGEYSQETPRLEVPGLKVKDTKFEKGDISATVTGTIENDLEKDADYLGVLTRFWKDDVVIAGGLDNISDVPAGENWSFEANYGGYGDRWKNATDYDVIPDLTIY